MQALVTAESDIASAVARLAGNRKVQLIPLNRGAVGRADALANALTAQGTSVSVTLPLPDGADLSKAGVLVRL